MIVCNTSSKEKVLRIIAERIIKEHFLYPIKFSHLVLPRELYVLFISLRVKQGGIIATKSGKARLQFNRDDYPAVVVSMKIGKEAGNSLVRAA